MLRKVLHEAADAEPVIETVSKRGCRFAASVRHETGPDTAKIPFAVAGSFRRLVPAIVAAGLLLIAALASSHWRPGAQPGGDRVGARIPDCLERSEVKKALTCFERASQLDALSALAYAGIAEAEATMVTMGVGDPKLNLAKAREAAMQALRLNSNVGLPYVSLGVVRLLADFDLAAAERAYTKALQLEPDLVPALFRYACLLAQAGRLGEARVLIQHALQRDPVSSLLVFQAAKIEYFDRHYAEAIAGLPELLEREPSFSAAQYYWAMSLGQLGRTQQALHHLRQSRLHASLLETDEAWLRSLNGDRERARALMAARHALVRDGRAKATVLFLPAIDSGDPETAIWSLNDMWRTREIELLALKVDPRFDMLRTDPHFRGFIDRIWPLERAARVFGPMRLRRLSRIIQSPRRLV